MYTIHVGWGTEVDVDNTTVQQLLREVEDNGEMGSGMVSEGKNCRLKDAGSYIIQPAMQWWG